MLLHYPVAAPAGEAINKSQALSRFGCCWCVHLQHLLQHRTPSPPSTMEAAIRKILVECDGVICSFSKEVKRCDLGRSEKKGKGRIRTNSLNVSFERLLS